MLAKTGLSLAESLTGSSSISVYPKLSAKPDTVESCLKRTQTDNKFLFMAAAAWADQKIKAERADRDARWTPSEVMDMIRKVPKERGIVVINFLFKLC